MDDVQRRTPTTIKTLDGEKAAPTEAEIDQMLFDIVQRWCGGATTAPAPEPAIPTETELRDQARELGLPVPPPRQGTAGWFRHDMLRLLESTR
jgi:hypothetical protein